MSTLLPKAHTCIHSTWPVPIASLVSKRLHNDDAYDIFEII